MFVYLIPFPQSILKPPSKFQLLYIVKVLLTSSLFKSTTDCSSGVQPLGLSNNFFYYNYLFQITNTFYTYNTELLNDLPVSAAPSLISLIKSFLISPSMYSVPWGSNPGILPSCYILFCKILLHVTVSRASHLTRVSYIAVCPLGRNALPPYSKIQELPP